MIKLLIVDDEPYTVDGLYEMLSEVPDLDLDVYRTYSAEEAIQRLTRAKMDIVLSDIRMPEMDGIELQQWIRARWPKCKVIFLTGIGDISSIQRAIRGGGVDYILKTEGDESILSSIRKAIKELEEEASNEQFVLRAKEQVKQELTLLRRDWFNSLTDIGGYSLSGRKTRFQELEIPLSAEASVLLVHGRVDRWKENTSPSNKTLFINAIQNIAEEYLRPTAFMSVLLYDSQFIWLIQPHRIMEETAVTSLEEQWTDTLTFVAGMLDSIQSTTKRLLHLPISLVTTGRPSAWEDVPRDFQIVKKTMVLGLGNGEEMLITQCEPDKPQNMAVELSPQRLLDLELALESGQPEAFAERLEFAFAKLPNRFRLYAQTYYSIAVLLLGQMNKASNGIAPEDNMVDRLMDLGSHPSKDAALKYLLEVADTLFSRRNSMLVERTNGVIHKLNQHIRDHLDGDLSLNTLADLVYLNSSYLSALYKQNTGRNLSDVIADTRVATAKELLAIPKWKIHEIALRIGFGTAGYFTRFFKKHTGVTPSEYRAELEA
ncbi:response regulator transcription factor [Cohnella hashimotonis]|uniref:Response regulator n=1 Tax=Cohnella hashimotonis TaxID=2826895 RepID=A0ABT6TKS6_9BACL|nr:response regulator [Cohnella hashimotonis]MDI4647449.1 response regulator [Cohnella hashimotonis]